MSPVSPGKHGPGRDGGFETALMSMRKSVDNAL